MSRLECLGKSCTGSQQQVAVKVTSTHAEIHKPNAKVEKKTVNDKPCSSLPACAPPHSVQVSCQESQKSGFPSGEVLNTDAASKDQNAMQPSDMLRSTTLGPAHAPPAAEPLPTHEANGEDEQTEEEDVEDEDLKAPVELIIKFLRAVMDRDFQLASKLCQMILIYEPDNPEASEFLPLIQKKLFEEQEAEQSTEEDEEEDDEDDDSAGDEESSQSSSCSSSSCSSSSPSDDEEEEEKHVNRHKPCPPSHL